MSQLLPLQCPQLNKNTFLTQYTFLTTVLYHIILHGFMEVFLNKNVEYLKWYKVLLRYAYFVKFPPNARWIWPFYERIAHNFVFFLADSCSPIKFCSRNMCPLPTLPTLKKWQKCPRDLNKTKIIMLCILYILYILKEKPCKMDESK